MTVTVAATWTGSYAMPAGFIFPRPATIPLQVAVANTPGDWMLAIVTVRQEAAGAGVAVAVADDAHNWWEPVGAPVGDSPAAGVTRTMVWAAPAAAAASNVIVSPTGPAVAITALIVDVAGMQPWYQAAAIVTGDALAASAFSLSSQAPASQAVLVNAVATDLSTVGHTGPGAGWTGLPSVSAANGTDHTADVEQLAYWQVASGAVAASWTSSGAADWSGVIAGVLVSATQPAQPSPMWPAVVTEIAPGAGAQTVASQLAWVPVSGRSLSLSMQQGQQYTRAQLQAGTGSLTLDNPDGALIPPGGPWQLQLAPDGVTSGPHAASAYAAVAASGSYAVSGWLMSPQGWAAGGHLNVDWATGGGAFISTTSVTVPALQPGVPVLLTALVTAPGTAGQGRLVPGFAGVPPSTTLLYAAAGPAPSGPQLVPPAGTAWGAAGCTATILAPWQPGTLGIDSGTPVRQRVTWPGGAWQVSFHGDGSTAAPQASTGNVIPVTPGVTYTCSARLGASAPWAGGLELILSYYTSGSVLLTSFPSAALTGTGPVLATATGLAPPTAAFAAIKLQGAGTPPASTTFYGAAAPPAAGYLTPAPGVSWLFQNAATGSILGQWSPDPRGAPNPTPNYVAVNGYMKRWPWSAPGDMLRGQTQAELTDIWNYAAGALTSMAREEALLDNPYAFWPLADAVGSTTGSNIAMANSNPLVLTPAKYGTSGATITWSATPPSGALLGDSSAKVKYSGQAGGATGMYSQAMLPPSLSTGYGWALGCYDQGYPSISNGVTVECWFMCTSNTNTTGFGFSNSGNVLTVPNSSFPNGTPVVFTSSGPALPTGMTAGTIYYVIAASGATFQISTTVGGSAVTLSSNSVGFCATTTPYDPLILSLRNVKGNVAAVRVNNVNGNLELLSPSGTATIDSGRDWRLSNFSAVHLSLAITRTTWRVMLDGGDFGSPSGTFSPAIPSKFDELWFGGVNDRGATGYAMPGFLALAALYPVVLPQNRVLAHYWAAGAGMSDDYAHERVERILGYQGLDTARRLVLQQPVLHEEDFCTSGQDVGGSSAATSASNITQSTLPAMLYVAPTGDICYTAKSFQWNNPVAFTLGDNVAAGEIPFRLDGMATDYDPARVANDVQFTQLDSQSITSPAGTTSAGTMNAVVNASQLQYGDQPYQNTGYLLNDYNAGYTAGSSLLDLANWVANTNAKPRNRVPAVQVNAAAYPQAWPLWASASPGDMVQVNVRPPTAATSPLISGAYRVTQVRRDMQFSQDGTSASITLTLDSAPEFNALTCDDAVRGLLNGTNVLGW